MKKDFKLVITTFCARQFDKVNKKASQIESSIEEMQNHLNSVFLPENLKDGYAPFCKHLFIKNFTPTILDYAEITESNKHLLLTDYEARTEKELPVLVRYFPRSVIPPQKASYLDIILYSREQCDQENKAMNEPDPYGDTGYEWGVVSIKPTDVDYELPMDPITMMRNALGVEHGGSGVPLEKAKYVDSVTFWRKYARIRTMGYEEAIPPLPTRNEELAMIQRYADSFIAQPSWRFEQNHSRRLTNLEIEDNIRKVKRHYWLNFTLGLLISSPLIYYVGSLSKRSNTGVPYYYRSKYYFTAPKFFNEGKRMKTMLLQIGLWYLLGKLYANRYTDTTFTDDEHLENYKIYKML